MLRPGENRSGGWGSSRSPDASASAREPVAVARAQQLAEWRSTDTAALSGRIRRRHCLAVIARELGFHGWPHAAAVLRGTDSSDFGTLLYPKGGEVHWNIWSASYEEA